MGAGSVVAVVSLSGRIGAGRRVMGRIDALQHYPELDVLESRITREPGGPAHAAGQFAFVTSDRREGAHPYTIASAWQAQQPQITFITKALGDHTKRLRDTLKPGMVMSVAGPCG